MPQLKGKTISILYIIVYICIIFVFLSVFIFIYLPISSIFLVFVRGDPIFKCFLFLCFFFRTICLRFIVFLKKRYVSVI